MRIKFWFDEKRIALEQASSCYVSLHYRLTDEKLIVIIIFIIIKLKGNKISLI